MFQGFYIATEEGRGIPLFNGLPTASIKEGRDKLSLQFIQCLNYALEIWPQKIHEERRDSQAS